MPQTRTWSEPGVGRRGATGRHPRRPHRAATALAAAAALGVVAAVVSAAGPPPLPPDVVLLSIDTLRRDHLPLYGYPLDTAPCLTELARSSVTFDQAVAASVLTAPSHASMLTGLDPFAHGVLLNKGSLRDGVPTLAELLRSRGFRTAGFVSSAVLARRTRLDHGFEVYDDDVGPALERAATATLGRAAAWLAAAPTSQPAFLFVHLFEPHYPYSPPAEELLPFLPPGDSGGPSPPYPELHAMRERGFTASEIETLGTRYDGEIRSADRAVGELVRLLRGRGTLDRTLLVVVADHGETLDDRAWMFDHGARVYDEQARVPLVVRFPSAAHGGTRVEVAVTHVDLLPTVLEAVGVAPPPSVAGVSLTAAMHPRGSSPRRTLVTLGRCDAERVPHLPVAPLPGGQVAAVRYGAFKLVVYPTADGETYELFDLARDPGERANLAAARAATVRILRRRLDLWLGGRPELLRSSGGRALTSAEENALRALGYVE